MAKAPQVCYIHDLQLVRNPGTPDKSWFASLEVTVLPTGDSVLVYQQTLKQSHTTGYLFRILC